MALELWFHHEASAFVRKPLLVAHELGVDLDEHRVDFQSPEALDEYAKLNPNRKFPALRDGELVLWESNAILGYLASLHGEHLLGGSPQQAAQVQQWLYWELAHFGPTILGLSNLRLGFLPKPPRTDEELETELGKLCRILNATVERSAYLTGEEPTLADFAVIADFSFADEAKLPLGERAPLEAWRRRMQERDSWKHTEQRKVTVLRAAGIEI